MSYKNDHQDAKRYRWLIERLCSNEMAAYELVEFAYRETPISFNEQIDEAMELEAKD